MRRSSWLCAALLAFWTVGCAGAGRAPRPPQEDPDNVASRLGRGDWMVSQATRVSKVLEPRPNLPPRHVGFLIASDYRQVRGGPVFTMYKVTTLNRDEQIGHIDQLGRGTRYEPRRNGTFESVDVGIGTLTQQVAAIFGLPRGVQLEPTSERRLAFEALDRNGDSLLSPEETAEYGDRIRSADANRDGRVDFEEFEAIDVL